ncbi:unnamed protein product, partial [Rotaria sp. Silwood1]
ENCEHDSSVAAMNALKSALAS